MTSFDYSRATKTADRLLSRFGQTGTLSKSTPGAGDPWNPGSPTVTTYAVTLVRIGYTLKERDGTIVQAGDDRVYIAVQSLSVSPDPSDQLTIGTETWSIVASAPLTPGGVTLLWEMQIRR